MFKGDRLIDSGVLKRSRTYRNLIDFAALNYGVVKMFSKGRDIQYFQEGDYGVYLNRAGKEIIESYIKIGKRFQLLDLDMMVPNECKEQVNYIYNLTI